MLLCTSAIVGVTDVMAAETRFVSSADEVTLRRHRGNLSQHSDGETAFACSGECYM